jgi:hypothetical protein
MFKNLCLAGQVDWVLGSRLREGKECAKRQIVRVGSNPVWCRSSYIPHNINQNK